jgi:hypothetical protein
MNEKNVSQIVGMNAHLLISVSKCGSVPGSEMGEVIQVHGQT